MTEVRGQGSEVGGRAFGCQRFKVGGREEEKVRR